ncbi:transmembrane protein, putative [Medicago truncatula]|uniref:Transmembrane protein, putative n=1 Tax=Medicago truncatula TaxID=3880 RepID=G7JWV7_MEDTR|nr:transmembrane protein, putative [Medicago truncatula]
MTPLGCICSCFCIIVFFIVIGLLRGVPEGVQTAQTSWASLKDGPQEWGFLMIDFGVRWGFLMYMSRASEFSGTALGLLITLFFRKGDVGTTGLFNQPLLAVNSVGSLNSLKVNGPQFTAEFNISISVYNPASHSRVYYDAVSAAVFYRGESLVLSKISLPSFTTHSHSISVVKMTLLVNMSDDFGGVATKIALSRKNGMVEFGLIVSALFKYKNRWAQSQWTSLKAVCNPLKFAVSPNDYNTTTPGILLESLLCF